MLLFDIITHILPLFLFPSFLIQFQIHQRSRETSDISAGGRTKGPTKEKVQDVSDRMNKKINSIIAKYSKKLLDTCTSSPSLIT